MVCRLGLAVRPSPPRGLPRDAPRLTSRGGSASTRSRPSGTRTSLSPGCPHPGRPRYHTTSPRNGSRLCLSLHVCTSVQKEDNQCGRPSPPEPGPLTPSLPDGVSNPPPFHPNPGFVSRCIPMQRYLRTPKDSPGNLPYAAPEAGLPFFSPRNKCARTESEESDAARVRFFCDHFVF